MVALARDLRDEFCVHLVKSEKPIFETLTNLLKTKDPDQLEWSLICLAHLFKILKPYLKKNFLTVFNSILTLLDNDSSENISNFAVECFAFIARDITEKEKFLTAILTKLSAIISQRGDMCSGNLYRGCSQLLFEVIRGVNGQFHSCAEAYLHVYFGLLSKLRKQQSELLYDILSGMVAVLVQYIAPANIQIFWEACYHTMSKFKAETNLNYFACRKLLLLIGQTIEIRDGTFLTNPNQFVTAMIKVIDEYENSDDCLRCISHLVTVLLLSKNLTLTQLDASRIVKRVLAIPSTDIFESFVWNCVKYSQFEVLILPELLRYIDSNHFGLSSLELIAKIILYKSPRFGDGISFDSIHSYPIRMRSDKCLELIKSIIINVDLSEAFFSNPREFLLALVIYPHILGAEVGDVLTKVNELIGRCLNALISHNREALDEAENVGIQTQNKRVLFILSTLIEAQIRLREMQMEKYNQAKMNNLKYIVQKLVQFSACEGFLYIHALRLLDLIISYEAGQPRGRKNTDFNIDLFKMIHNELSNNLTSRHPTVRRITAHLLHQLTKELKINHTELAIYGIFFDIESIDTNIHTYREQLLLFQRIEPNSKFISALNVIYEPMKLDPLKYLLGCLHINFNLLWKPVMELIVAYFSELNVECFWTLFKDLIERTTVMERNKMKNDVEDDVDFIDSESCLCETYLNIWRNTERPVDLVNYRILLWRIIPSLGMLREIKNREIVTIFLDFIEHEYKRTIDRDVLTLQAQLKRKMRKPATSKDFNKTENEFRIVDDDGDEKNIDSNNEMVGTQRTLINILQVFVNQNNPKALHREPELWNLYMELLSHRNIEVQKLALHCVAAYKYNYLQPYMDHLTDLVDDTKFKAAIVNFKIDKESGIVQPEHRPQLMPIVIRILYSKMITRVGGQKTSNQNRKSLVMRFLGGCHEEEVLLMLHMSFWMFESEFKDDARDMCLSVSNRITHFPIYSILTQVYFYQ